MKVIGRDKCLPAVMTPLCALGDIKVGTLTADSFFVGQHLSEDSSRLIRFDQRWKPFMGFNDDEILKVKLWRHPKSRLPVIDARPATPPKKTHKEQAPLEDPFAMFNQKDMDPQKLLNSMSTLKEPSVAESRASLNPFLDPNISPSKAIPPEVGVIMVRGTITSVSRDKNGLPRKEGPVFSILWDDGLSEVEVSLQEMQNIVKVDEKELGGYTSLTDDVPYFLEEVGKIVGDGTDYIRKVRLDGEEIRHARQDLSLGIRLHNS
jgi:hypothetical protein